MPRRSLTQAMAETNVLTKAREANRARVARARREAVAPREPSQALDAYTATMRTYAKRVEVLVNRLVVDRLPILGSGDPLDVAALESGLRELDVELDKLADRSRRSAYAAAKRASTHARQEAQRVLNVTLPKNDMTEAFRIQTFTDLGVARLRAAGTAQVARIRQAITQHVEGASMRQDILKSLWVSRVRGRMIARDQVYGLHVQSIGAWAQTVGSKKYTWHTRHDERVRYGHQRLDGRVFSWDDPPNTGRQEGNNHPGGAGAPNCRCTAIPVEAIPPKR